MFADIAMSALNDAGVNLGDIKLFPNKHSHVLLIERLFALEFSELDKVSGVVEGYSASLQNELIALRACIHSLSGVFNSFPTTIEEDEKILASKDLPANARFAVLLRKTQKE